MKSGFGAQGINRRRDMAPFEMYVSQLEELFDRLLVAPELPISDASKFPVAAGCYAILDSDQHVYVGIGKNLRRRIKNHVSGRAEKSAFAFRLARLEIQAPVTYQKKGGRSDLMTRPEFVEAMKLTTERVKRMSAQCVTIEDASLRYLFEFYAAKCLNTKYNDFNEH